MLGYFQGADFLDALSAGTMQLGKGSAAILAAGAGFQPATRARETGHSSVTRPRAIRIRQDAGCCGLEARAPLFPLHGYG